MNLVVLTTVFLAFWANNSIAQYHVRTDEVFVIQLSPSLFNVSDIDPLGMVYN